MKIARGYLTLLPVVSMALVIAGCTVCAASDGSGEVFPAPKRMNLTGNSVTVQGVALTVEKDLQDRSGSSMAALRKLVEESKTGIPVSIGVKSSKDEGSLKPEVRSALEHPEAYWLDMKKDAVKILGADREGALRGATTLEQLLTKDRSRIPEGYILDWPDHRVRGLHLVLHSGRKGGRRSRDKVLGPAEVQDLIVKARYAKLNTLVLSLSDGVRLKTMSRMTADDAWTIDEFLGVVKFARENGMDVIPEIRLLTHQEKLLQNAYPSLMYNKSTYDPRKEETYSVVLPILDEVIDLIHPKAVHIGHDEVAGHNEKSRRKWLDPGEDMLPPDLFLRDVQRVHAHLQKRGVETWMWGDMLIAPDEFPGMLFKHLHGSRGYAALRGKIPAGIVIVDWHYYDKQSDFPSALAFSRAGHRVIGSTFRRPVTIRNFSRYLANMPGGAMGMIATTWSLPRKGDWASVDNIIHMSGESYWNAK